MLYLSCRGRQFFESYDPKGYANSIKEHCLTLYINGMGFRGIQRATAVNHNPVINWVKKVGSSLLKTPELKKFLKLSK